MKAFLLFIISASSTSFATSQPSVECAVQMTRADQSLYGDDDTISLQTKNVGVSTGMLIFRFPQQKNQQEDVEVQLTLESNRSSWLDNSPRLNVVTRLMDRSTKKIVAMGEAHSDQMWTPAMLRWRQNGEGPRVIMKTLNPELQDQLEKITDPRIVEIRQTDNDGAIVEAVSRKFLPANKIQRVDTVCLVKN